MSKYIGARYICNNPFQAADGKQLNKGDITEMLSEEAAMNDNMFEPAYEVKKKKEPVKTEKTYSRKKNKEDKK